MRILINCSNLKVGGGLQVADSICQSLDRFSQHQFVVVLSSPLSNTYAAIQGLDNVKVFSYDIKNNIRTLVFGRDVFLDSLVEKEKSDIVITIFGPSRWNPKCEHLCGFARPHLVLSQSLFFSKLKKISRLKLILSNILLKYFFKRSTNNFYTENSYISSKLQNILPNSKVYTITNYYNQIYDTPEKWIIRKLPQFDGVTLLTVTAPYPHKNLQITLKVSEVLRQKYPNFNFRFVMTIDERDFPSIPNDLKKNFFLIGKVDISECPSLYRQADIMCQPSLLECFTATYPEAMRMEVPIVTTDLEFARGLCEEAALYYAPLNPEAAADAIYQVVSDESLRSVLIDKGTFQLKKFDTYKQRVEKLMEIAENLVNN